MRAIKKQWEVILLKQLTSHIEQCPLGVYVPCIYRMPGGVIVGDLGLCSMCDINFLSAITSLVGVFY